MRPALSGLVTVVAVAVACGVPGPNAAPSAAPATPAAVPAPRPAPTAAATVPSPAPGETESKLGEDNPPELGEVLFSDEMSRPTSGLTGGDHVDGVFVLEAIGPYSAVGYYERLTLPQDLSIEVDVKVEGARRWKAGLFGWIDPAFLERLEPHLEGTRVWPSALLSSIGPGPSEDYTDESVALVSAVFGEWNHLQLVSHGTELWVYMNGVLLGYESDVAGSRVGKAGFHVTNWDASTSVARFDNFVVRALASDGTE